MIIYKCDIQGSYREHPDCSLCKTRNAKYNCTWCSNTCAYSETCLHTPASECPKPRIDMVNIIFYSKLWQYLEIFMGILRNILFIFYF